MGTRTMIIDLRQGDGNQPMYGVVTVQRTRATSQGTFEVLPWETKLKLVNGKAVLEQAVTDGNGPMYGTAYLIRVQLGFCGTRYGFMAALPDGDTPISTGQMPMVSPLTGEGIYMDAQEWNDLYGDLPNKVSALESSQATQNTQIASLQTGKANTTHTHVIGDVTGLQAALNAKGNASMRVDTAVGTRIFITDGTTERMVSGDTGLRDITALATGVTSGKIYVQRENSLVTLTFDTVLMGGATGANYIMIPTGGIPSGFRPPFTFWYNNVDGPPAKRRMGVTATGALVVYLTPLPDDRYTGTIVWRTTNPWPSSLPGIPA